MSVMIFNLLGDAVRDYADPKTGGGESMEALLEYRQTDVCYGGVWAVRGVSFTLHAGESWAW